MFDLLIWMELIQYLLQFDHFSRRCSGNRCREESQHRSQRADECANDSRRTRRGRGIGRGIGRAQAQERAPLRKLHEQIHFTTARYRRRNQRKREKWCAQDCRSEGIGGGADRETNSSRRRVSLRATVSFYKWSRASFKALK